LKKTLAYFLIFSLMFYSNALKIQSQFNDISTDESSLKLDYPINNLKLNYEEHDPIMIFDDSDLSAESSEGDGSEEFPYIIEGWRIGPGIEIGIEIRSTTKSFVIRNCWIEGSSEGIHVEYTETSTINITNNVIINNAFQGIYIRDSTASTTLVTDNICNFNGNGIILRDTLDVEVRNNTCNNNGANGIDLSNTLVDTVLNNTCNYNQESGIYAYESEWYPSYSENICIGNEEYGIFLAMTGSYGEILDNYCKDNSISGMYLEAAWHNLISENIFFNNTNYGLELNNAASFNDVHHNYFYFNNLGGTSQALDEGSSNTWYETGTSEGNYWKNWYNGVYPIDGTAGKYDLYPLDLDPPEITSVADIEYIHGEIGNIIQWNVSDLNPTIYFVYKDFVEIHSGSWSNDVPIIVLVDGLEIGTYYYQLFILDGLNRSSLDTVIVTVAAGISEFNSITIITLLIVPIIASIYFYKKNKKVNNL